MRYLQMLMVVLLISSCSVDVSKYRNTSPALDIKRYFTGDLVAWGLVQDHKQQVTRRFCVEINGQWQGDRGILDENFYFDDGETSNRVWTLIKQQDGRYIGTADDVIGQATGQQRGFAFHWQYQLAVSVDGTIYHLNLDDWMYQIDKNRLFNKTGMYKFGVKVAEITLFFDRTVQRCINREVS